MPAKPYNLDMTGSMPRPLTGPSARTSSPARYYSQEIPASFDPQSRSHNTIESPSRSQGPYATVPSSTYAPGSHSTTYDDEKDAAFDDYDRHSLASPRRGWGSRRKVIIAAIIAAILILAIALGLGLGLGLNRSSPYDFTLSNATCTNEMSFTQGGASRQPVSNVADGIGAGQDTYTYYSGPSENFPPSTSWISFENLWAGNYHILKTGCSLVYGKKDNSDKNLQEIYDAIQNRANASLVDHRLILAVILQESAACVRVEATTSYGGVSNTGLMQAHDGHKFSSSHSEKSILAMVQDGTQGTLETHPDTGGWGYVQHLNTYGSAYRAARSYNSGLIPASGNLSEAAGATACYVSDLANRMTGWANGTRHCED